MIPHKIIDKKDFDELVKAEGDMIILFKLTNIPFAPPLPEGWSRPPFKQIHMNILLMNVTEPCIYKDPHSKSAYIILNGYDEENTFTYDNFNDIHIVKNAWGYRLAPSYWDPDDEDDELSDAWYVFKHTTREGQGEDDV